MKWKMIATNKEAVEDVYNRVNEPRNISAINPNAQVVDPRSSLEDAASALRALQDTLQKDVFDKLETALESLSEAQKD